MGNGPQRRKRRHVNNKSYYRARKFKNKKVGDLDEIQDKKRKFMTGKVMGFKWVIFCGPIVLSIVLS